MRKVKVIGSRKMLDMPAGTMFVPIEYRLGHDVRKYLDTAPLSAQKLAARLHIYVDNGGSASLNLEPEYPEEELFYYDYNVVGDAFPVNTLYVILTEDDLPKQIKTFLWGAEEPDEACEKLPGVVREFDEKSGYYNYYRILSKEQFLKIRENFIEENCPERAVNYNDFNNWARQSLETDYPKEEDQYILNLETELEIVDE